MRYLLDSTVLIDHGNDDREAVALLQRLFEEGHELYTRDVVTCKTLSRGDEERSRHLRVLLDALEYLSTSPSAARWAAESFGVTWRVASAHSAMPSSPAWPPISTRSS